MNPNIPETLYYTKTHEWISIVEEDVTIGITAYAVEQMNKEIVSVELPQVGAKFNKEDIFGVIDSVKAAFDLYCPVGLTVTQINKAVLSEPSIICDFPYERGWFIKGKLANKADIKSLLSASEYEKLIKSEN